MSGGRSSAQRSAFSVETDRLSTENADPFFSCRVDVIPPPREKKKKKKNKCWVTVGGIARQKGRNRDATHSSDLCPQSAAVSSVFTRRGGKGQRG